MRQIIKNVYKFDELSSEAQEKAVEKLYDINVGYDWWDSTYGDAENIGLKISTFDIDRGSYCKGIFIDGAMETAEKIMKEHGDSCDTYKEAKKFFSDRDALVEKYSDGVNTSEVTEENEYDFDSECDELAAEFLKIICEDYLSVLRKEYEYLTSEEAIIETIKANEYEFDEEGNLT